MAEKGKRLRKAYEGIDRLVHYELTEALEMVRKNTSDKFDETVEIALNLGVDPRHADQMVRGVVSLPNGTGKSVRVAVFAWLYWMIMVFGEFGGKEYIYFQF